MSNEVKERFTEREFWDDYWRGTRLPAAVEWTSNAGHNEILKVLTRELKTRGLKTLEVGGAPGQYLAFLVKEFGAEGHVLDYSPIGCAATRRNFELLKLPVTVHEGDLFSDATDPGRFDVVYSLGFIEHFGDLTGVMERHVRLTRPGGLVIVGCPNFRGINGWFLSRLAPELLSKHNTEMMDPAGWTRFEEELGLKVLFRGCIGGFEPGIFNRWEKPSVRHAPLKAAAGLMQRAFRWKPFKLVNDVRFSQYSMAVYRVP
jgi:SAM-dependent methyltransferase